MALKRNKRKIFGGNSKSSEKPSKKSNKSEVNINDEKSDDINESRFKIVSGLRKKNRKIRFVSYGIILALIIALIIVHLLTPTGLLETIQNKYTTIGKGDFPVDVYSDNSTDFITTNDVTCLVNDSFFEIYNNRGKLLQAASHGLSNPRLEASEARLLLFDRDRYAVKVYNYSSELYARTFENTIISADVSRSGNYAVVTGSDTNYASLFVYNKNNEVLYTWNSADYYITDVALSDNGKLIAISLLNAKQGSFESSVYILDFDSITPKYRFDFDGTVTSLRCVNKNYLVVSGADSAYVLPWDGSAYINLNINGVVRNISEPLDGCISVCYGRENNETINNVVVINKEGKVGTAFQFNSKITDCAVTSDSVALLSENTVYVYGHDGSVISQQTNDLKLNFIGLISDYSVIACDNSQLIKLNPSKE